MSRRMHSTKLRAGADRRGDRMHAACRGEPHAARGGASNARAGS